MANPPSVMVPATRAAVVLWVGAMGLMAVLVAAILLRAAWYSRSIAVTDIEHVHGLAVDPQDPRVLWVGTHAGLGRWGGAGGRRRRRGQEAFSHAPAAAPRDPAVLYGWSVAGRTGLYRSRTGG